MLKNITFSVDEKLIYMARIKAREQRQTLNALFRSWLSRYAGQQLAHESYVQLMKRLKYVKVGKTFKREELNDY
jgi:hypothetical protein